MRVLGSLEPLAWLGHALSLPKSTSRLNAADWWHPHSGWSMLPAPHNELLGMEPFCEAVERGMGAPERTRQAVLDVVERHAKGRPRVDDQTLVVMAYRGARVS